MNEDLKICSKCHVAKEKVTDFYMCSGSYRSECKACTIKRNVKYQSKMQSWKYKFGDDESRREYMRDYYAKNPAKYAEYREKFRENHPGYHKKYYHARKDKGKI